MDLLWLKGSTVTVWPLCNERNQIGIHEKYETRRCKIIKQVPSIGSLKLKWEKQLIVYSGKCNGIQHTYLDEENHIRVSGFC